MKLRPSPFLAVLLGTATACQKELIPASPQAASANPLTQAYFLNHPIESSLKNVSPIDLLKLAPSKEKTNFDISLQTSEGQPIGSGTSLQPNTSYRVLIEGKTPARYVLKMADSFEVIQGPSASEVLNAVYLIKTGANIPPQLYLSVVPLHAEKNALTKGQPVGFLLPK